MCPGLCLGCQPSATHLDPLGVVDGIHTIHLGPTIDCWVSGMGLEIGLPQGFASCFWTVDLSSCCRVVCLSVMSVTSDLEAMCVRKSFAPSAPQLPASRAYCHCCVACAQWQFVIINRKQQRQRHQRVGISSYHGPVKRDACARAIS